ncbi:AsmA-like C-terminal region-containing protein [Longitalea luteola]|uniref:AsmA-like C-terminal region-containing protein n=1 Tax=Longitalea luteola TaxID=2812563 RepID=UPI001A957209|nr:AsmA-like C-terminal region-containing protein [Longitalea luteola]
MKSKTRKRLIRFLLIPVIVLVLLVATAFTMLVTQQSRLVKLAVKEFNKKLSGTISVESSKISLFENFPYISVRLNNVRLYGGKSTTQKPLFQAERMFAGFSLKDILNQNYNVKVIGMKNGHLDVVAEKNGQVNIVEASRITSDTTTATDTAQSPLKLDIRKIILRNMAISYLDKPSGRHIVTQIERIQSSVQNDSLKINAALTGKFVIDYTSPGNSTLFRQKHLETDLAVLYEKSTELVTINTGKLKVEDAVFNITGSASLQQNNNAVDIKFGGDKPDLQQLFAFVPESVAKQLKHFRYDGHVNFEGTVKGSLANGQMPRIDVSFGCTKAWLHNTQSDKKLDSLAFKGYYTNGDQKNSTTSELRLLGVHAKPGTGIFDGNFIMRNFDNPKILMQVDSDLELGFIGAFLGIKDLQRITGQISLKMNFKELVDMSMPEQQVGRLTEGVQSELTVKNLTFRIPNYPYNVERLNLHADMKNGFVRLDSLACRIGQSDFYLNGSLSDLPAIFHHQTKPVVATLNARSQKMVLRELLNIDTTKNRRGKEEIYGFNIGVSLTTSVNELLHPNPLPKGIVKIERLNAGFKRYPHTFHDFGAELTIADTSLRLKNFAGLIDSTDIAFSGRVNNYALWFDSVKKGRTEIAFDLKSKRLALRDLLGRRSKRSVPKAFHDEVATNVWLRSKTMLRYDSVFKFAKIKLANVSGHLTKHAFELDSIKGTVMFNTENFIKIDTLTGKVGRSDFDINMRLYTGKDSTRRMKENYLRFNSRFLDVDQMTNYKFDMTMEKPRPRRRRGGDTSAAPEAAVPVQTVSSPSVHAKAFNIFQVPFVDFKASVNIGKIKYRRLWIKNVASNVRMLENHHLYLDTLHMEMAGGKIDARAHFNGNNPEKIYLRSRIKVDDIDLEKMMLKLDYLGQDYVINKNIRGHITGQVKGYMRIHPDLTPMLDQSQAQLDINIYNGELINFAPMAAMSAYFKDKNMMKVRFDTLRNVLTFKDNTLNIPTMNINSSLGFLEFSGTQSLDMNMQYYVRIPLKMVTQVGFRMLFNKKQEEVDPDQVDAIEYRDKDRRVRFMNLTITGTPDNYKVNLGKPKKA